MAVYSTTEVEEILLKLSQKPASEVKFIKFERLGISVNLEEAEVATEVCKDESLLYSCSVCSKKLASAHLLDLHVTENHDSYFDLQKEKKPMFSCYLEECKQKSSTPEERKNHCITAHKFPHDFRFDNVSSKKKSPNSEVMDTSETAKTKPTSSTSSSKPKITNFHFGHKSQKTFNSNIKAKDPIESMVVDLKESLPEA